MTSKINFIVDGLKTFFNDETLFFSVSENALGITCSDVKGFTKKQVSDKIKQLQLDWDNLEYQRLRKYPSIGDQLDMLWHAIDTNTLNKTSDFYLAIKAVKDANPKAE